jgi:hypothetical protein
LLGLAFRDVGLGFGLDRSRQIGALAQELSESVAGLLPLMVLFKTAGLIVDAINVTRLNEQVGQQIHAFAEIPGEARLAGRILNRLGMRLLLGGPREGRAGYHQECKTGKHKTHGRDSS